MRWPVLALLFTLAACASAQLPEIRCPQLRQYTKLQQQVLADELPKDGPESQVQIEDYFKLRQACRAK